MSSVEYVATKELPKSTEAAIFADKNLYIAAVKGGHNITALATIAVHWSYDNPAFTSIILLVLCSGLKVNQIQ